MFTKAQLQFIKSAMCAPQAAVPTSDEGAVARLFLATLDEVNAQLIAADSAPKLTVVSHEPA